VIIDILLPESYRCRIVGGAAEVMENEGESDDVDTKFSYISSYLHNTPTQKTTSLRFHHLILFSVSI